MTIHKYMLRQQMAMTQANAAQGVVRSEMKSESGTNESPHMK
jgi:hypothetical protein